MSSLRSWWRTFLYSGLQDLLGPEDRVKLLFINSIILFGLAVLGAFGLRDWAHGDQLLGTMTLGVASIVLMLYFTIWVTKSYRIGEWVLPFLMFGFFSYLTAIGGAGSTSVLWMLTYPEIVIFLTGSVRGSLFSGGFLVAEGILLFVPRLSPAFDLSLEYKLRLVGAYTLLFAFSVAFETIRLRAQKELAKTAAQLAAAQVETDGILTNVSEGIFLLTPDLTIADHHSRSLASLLETPRPGGLPLPTLLEGRIEERDLQAVRDYLPMFFLPDPPWHLMDEMNPLAEVTLRSSHGDRRLTFTFNPVDLSSGRRVLGTIRDITQSWELGRKLQEEEDRSERQMRHLFQIIHVRPELLLQFLHDAENEIDAVNRHLKDPKADPITLVEELFQGVHAVKGNAALVGLTAFAERVDALEAKIVAFRNTRPSWQDFLEMTVGLSVIQAEVTEIKDLLDRMATFQRGLEASTPGKDLLLLALHKAVEQLSHQTQLEVDLDTADFRADQVPDAHRKLLKDVLVQLVRNTFAHGLERPSGRQAAGKSPRGRIRVATTRDDQTLTLAYWDDGRGFDTQRLRALGAGGPGTPTLTEEQVLDLAFRPGVSTASPSLHAGRGVGLSLIRERVEAAGGQVRWRSVQGKGVAFDITLPIT